MSEIVQLYKDSSKTEKVYPKTLANATYMEDGKTTISEQLAEKANLNGFKANNNFAINNKNNGKIIAVFIDDDGSGKIRETLKPIFTSRGVPCNCALVGSYGANASPYFTDKAYVDEMLDLQNNHGWEVMSHTMAHINLNTSTDKEIEEDCIEFMSNSLKLGYRVNSIAYPWGAVTSTGLDIIAKYYDSGFIASERTNKYPNVNQYGMGRYALGSMMSPTLKTLEQFKALIDSATNETVLVFMTHCGNTTGTTLIENVVDYIISKNIPIVTVSDALRSHGNKVYSNNLKITNRGDIITDKYINFHNLDNTGINNDTLPNDILFPSGISITTFGASVTGFPTNGGTLETQKVGGYSYWRQDWKPHNNTDIYTRIATSVSAWGSWVKKATSKEIKYFVEIDNYKNESALCSTYPSGITTNIVTGFTVGNGFVTTYNIGGNAYNKQEFRKAGSNEVQSRVTLSNGDWGAWVKISA